MNNNKMNFDPITGQTINQNINSSSLPTQEQQLNVQSAQIQATPQVQPVAPVEPIQSVPSVSQNPTVNNTINVHQQMQNIPTIEQSKQSFINNIQTNNTTDKEEKKDGPNITFIIILFVIIFTAIFFLFPYLLKVLG